MTDYKIGMKTFTGILSEGESITGIIFAAEPTAESIKNWSEYSAVFFRTLVKEYGVTYNQLLYPYADALSLSGRAGAESMRIFGTHILLRNVPYALIELAMDEACPREAAEWYTMPFKLYDGAAKSGDIAEFLNMPAYALHDEAEVPSPSRLESFRRVGDFSKMLAGFVPHWRIRECARIFASFSEMAYRRSGGKIAGLLGGSLLLTPECDCPEALADIFTRKTGV